MSGKTCCASRAIGTWFTPIKTHQNLSQGARGMGEKDFFLYESLLPPDIASCCYYLRCHTHFCPTFYPTSGSGYPQSRPKTKDMEHSGSLFQICTPNQNMNKLQNIGMAGECTQHPQHPLRGFFAHKGKRHCFSNSRWGIPQYFFSCDMKTLGALPLLGSLWRTCLHLSFPGPPRELGKAKSAASVPLAFPLSGPAPRPELPLLCMAERLVPLDVWCELEALEEKELMSPRSPEEPPVCEGDTSVSHS